MKKFLIILLIVILAGAFFGMDFIFPRKKYVPEPIIYATLKCLNSKDEIIFVQRIESKKIFFGEEGVSVFRDGSSTQKSIYFSSAFKCYAIED